MNNSIDKAQQKDVDKKEWTAPELVNISVEETLGGVPFIHETGYYRS